MRVIVYGVDGTMGQWVVKSVTESQADEVVAGIAPRKSPLAPGEYKSLKDFDGQADLVIDFSHPANLSDVLDYGTRTGVPTLICTTGFTNEEIGQIQAAGASCPVLLSTNTSYGVNLLRFLLEEVSQKLMDYDVEIVEKHHNKKKDAPSGTAKTLAKAVSEGRGDFKFGRTPEDGAREPGEIGIHAVRGGTIVGEHDVIFAGAGEVLTFSHKAQSKEVFSSGALKTGRWLVGQPAGFYEMKDVFMKEEKA
jgi:4-hydroxy-tetrahydrodipicolinate reductase